MDSEQSGKMKKSIDRLDPRTGKRNWLSTWPDTAYRQYFELIGLIDDLFILIKASKMLGEDYSDRIGGKIGRVKEVLREADYRRQTDLEAGRRWPRWIITFMGESGGRLDSIRQDVAQATNAPIAAFEMLLNRALDSLAEFDRQAKAGPGPDGELVEYIIIDRARGFVDSDSEV